MTKYNIGIDLGGYRQMNWRIYHLSISGSTTYHHVLNMVLHLVARFHDDYDVWHEGFRVQRPKFLPIVATSCGDILSVL